MGHRNDRAPFGIQPFRSENPALRCFVCDRQQLFDADAFAVDGVWCDGRTCRRSDGKILPPRWWTRLSKQDDGSQKYCGDPNARCTHFGILATPHSKNELILIDTLMHRWTPAFPQGSFCCNSPEAAALVSRRNRLNGASWKTFVRGVTRPTNPSHCRRRRHCWI